MKGKKLLVSIITLIAMLSVLFGQGISYAEDSVLYVGIQPIKESGTGYGINKNNDR